MTRLRPILLLVALLGLSQAAIAHELRPAFLELIETAPDRFDVLWKVPARGEESGGGGRRTGHLSRW